jgi:hypothetical protein
MICLCKTAVDKALAPALSTVHWSLYSGEQILTAGMGQKKRSTIYTRSKLSTEKFIKHCLCLNASRKRRHPGSKHDFQSKAVDVILLYSLTNLPTVGERRLI